MLILLPTQLYLIHLLPDIKTVYLLEEPRYFTDFKFHKLKIMYHRATMQKYKQYLITNNIKCIYKEFHEINNSLYKQLNKTYAYYINPIDHKLHNKYKKLLSNAIQLDSPNFLLSPKDIIENKNIFYKNNKYSHNEFYKFQRKRLNILLEEDKPIGGKWSYDSENRKTLNIKITIPKVPKITKDKYYKEALEYVIKYFPNNYGYTDNWSFPIDTKSSLKWLKHFLQHKLNNFGPYEDAVKTDEPFLFHSVLSPMMNIGLLTDTIVIKETIKYYNKHNINIASIEGFIRQIIGWRNYMYSIYILEPKMHLLNTLQHTRKITDIYWSKIDIYPIDILIDKINKYAYIHHIERLMFLSNWFLLNRYDPKDVYRIFMEWTIDAYDWVMVPNVYGMGQYADNGMTMTRIYFSSSNYICKMSNIKKDNWSIIWDALYYSFINDNYDLLKNNYATSRQTIHWKNKTKEAQQHILEISKEYMNT